jgi:uncharacterized damage-inducible protein DinB
MADTSQTEAWLRGPVDGVDAWLMPAAHALIQAREDIEHLIGIVPAERVWAREGGAASVGFHIQHLGGALDRLFTYARGEMLSDAQKAALRAEAAPPTPAPTLAAVAATTMAQIARALDQLHATRREELLDDRRVGRAELPSNVLGLLFHAAEHTTRHVGQAITTARMLRSAGSPNVSEVNVGTPA